MKKFMITFLILVILGAVGFFFGWVQFSVPPGQFGVISSKTHGVDPDLVKSGEFRWVWFKLIPTNVQIAVFRLEPAAFTINFNSSLPSGNNYAAFLGLNNVNFDWNLRAEISFNITPDALVPLTESNGLSGQESLENYLQKTAQDIEVIVLRIMSSAEEDSQRLERLISGYQDTQMEREIRERFPYIRDFSFTVQSAKFPDFILYRQLRLVYEDFLTSQREYITSGFGRRAEQHIEAQLRFDELERYGDLLTRFPVLLEYMTLGLDRNQ